MWISEKLPCVWLYEWKEERCVPPYHMSMLQHYTAHSKVSNTATNLRCRPDVTYVATTLNFYSAIQGQVDTVDNFDHHGRLRHIHLSNLVTRSELKCHCFFFCG